MDNPHEETSQSNQTLHVSTRVAEIQFTGAIASSEGDDDHADESSDEEAVEALSLCSPPDDDDDIGIFYLLFLLGDTWFSSQTERMILWYE